MPMSLRAWARWRRAECRCNGAVNAYQRLRSHSVRLDDGVGSTGSNIRNAPGQGGDSPAFSPCVKRCPMANPGALRTPHRARGRCRSSVVEHPLGKGEVDSSILSGSTSQLAPNPYVTKRSYAPCGRAAPCGQGRCSWPAMSASRSSWARPSDSPRGGSTSRDTAGGEAVVRHQVALQRFELLAVFETDEEVRRDRAPHSNGRLGCFGFAGCG